MQIQVLLVCTRRSCPPFQSPLRSSTESHFPLHAVIKVFKVCPSLTFCGVFACGPIVAYLCPSIVLCCWRSLNSKLSKRGPLLHNLSTTSQIEWGLSTNPLRRPTPDQENSACPLKMIILNRLSTLVMTSTDPSHGPIYFRGIDERLRIIHISCFFCYDSAWAPPIRPKSPCIDSIASQSELLPNPSKISPRRTSLSA